MTLPTPKAVIFDWDNTLVNTWPIIHAALAETFAELGKEPWTLAQTKDRVSKSMRDSFPVIFGPNWEDAAEKYQRNYRKIHMDRLDPLPLSIDVLKRIRELGLCNVVVSNKKGPNLRKEIEHLGWGEYFDGIVGANDAKRDKPFVDPVHLAFEKSDITPAADVWFIGDSEVDLECARNTGCTAILYGAEAASHPEYSATHYRGFPYHAHVHDHTQTLKLF
ncbi:MAG: HAD family hydrolase [Rickettsiales bacterium]